MIDKEKVRELAEIIRRWMTFDEAFEKVTQWLEQNQPEPVVVGLSENQMIDLWSWLDHMEEEHHFKSKFQVMQEWHSKQTFAQPEVKELEKEYDSLWRNNKKLIAINNELKKQLEKLKSQQLKPNWDDAPDWANWLAQDSDGQWKWYELKPDTQVHGFSSSEGCRDEAEFLKDWQQTLEQRPKPASQVEVGQVWELLYDEYGMTVDVIAVGDMMVSDDYCESVTYLLNGKARTLPLSDFLAKFERVGGSE